jgi:hypothetical protein
VKLDYIETFSKEYAVTLRDDQFIFIDNSYSTKDVDDFTDEELAKFKAELNKLKTVTESSSPFICYDIKAVLSKHDKLTAALEEEKKRVGETQAQFTEQIAQLEKAAAAEKAAYAQQLEQEKQALLNKEKELNKVREEWQQKEKETELPMKEQKRQYDDLEKQAKEKEANLLLAQRESEERYRKQSEMVEAERKQTNAAFIKELRESANNKGWSPYSSVILLLIVFSIIERNKPRY